MRYLYTAIFLAYAVAIIWEGVLFGTFNWLALACLCAATAMGLLFRRGWVTLAALATSAISIAIGISELGAGGWPRSDLPHNSIILFWSMFWLWCPITVYRLAHSRQFSRPPVPS